MTPMCNLDIIREPCNCLEKDIIEVTLLGSRRKGRPRTPRLDNVMISTSLQVEQFIRNDGGKCGLVWPTVGLRTADKKKLNNVRS